MPGIHPSATFNQAQRIISVTLAANQMGLKWKKQYAAEHSKETVGGVKTLEAMGAMKQLSGGSMSVAAVDDSHQPRAAT